MTWILVVVGLGCGAAGIHAQRVSHRGATFVEARGQVISVRAQKTNDWWHLDIKFEYQSPNRSHVGHDSRLLRKSFKTEAEALSSVVERPGEAIDVYYDPERPEVALLKRNSSSFHFFGAAAVLWLSLALLWFVYDRTRAQK